MLKSIAMFMRGDSANRLICIRRIIFALFACAISPDAFITNPATRVLAEESPLPPARYLLAWGKEGTEPCEFHFPIGIAVTKSDEILVTDHYNNRVQKFDREGKFVSLFSVLPNPGGIAIDQSENLVISHFPWAGTTKEKTPDRVTIYDKVGKLIHELGKTGDGPLEFNYPGGIAIAPDGRIYVADQTNHRIQVLGTDGQFQSTWGKYGANPGEFGGNTNPVSRVGGPNFVTLDRNGNVYTTEAMPGRIQKFTGEGAPILEFGSLDDRPGGFGGDFKPIGKMRGPVGICCDRKDRLWISTISGRIQQFTNDGRFLRGFGLEQGSEQEQFLAPHGLAIDSRGDLYVVDTYNHRIQKFDVSER